MSTQDYYKRFDTRTLEAVRRGFEREYDLACTGEPYRLPTDYLTDRMSLIDRVLEQRLDELNSLPIELRRAQAKSITRWHEKGGGRA